MVSSGANRGASLAATRKYTAVGFATKDAQSTGGPAIDRRTRGSERTSNRWSTSLQSGPLLLSDFSRLRTVPADARTSALGERSEKVRNSSIARQRAQVDSSTNVPVG